MLSCLPCQGADVGREVGADRASASYRYVPTEDVKLGFAHTSLDTSAWQSALGLGYRF